jgi:hypothetical protein
MEEGNIKTLLSAPINLKSSSLTRKEKTAVKSSGFAFIHPFG